MKKAIHFILSALALLFLFPVVETFFLSFYSSGGFTLKAWRELFFDCFIFYPMFWNSVLYSSVITAGSLFIIVPGAFGLIMVRGKIAKWIFYLYLVLMMMPLQVTLLPNYIGLRDLHLLNTGMCIILPMLFSVFGTVLMHQYMENMELSQIEAARLETNSVFRILLHIVMPQMKPCIYAVSFFTFIESYNMLEQPMLFLKNKRLQNLTVFIADADQYTGDILFPASVIFIVPVLLFYLLLHESLQQNVCKLTGGCL